MFSIKSLSGAINSNIELNIKIGGIILLLCDMYNLITALIQVNFSNLCENTKEGLFEDFEDFMKFLYGQNNLAFNIRNGRAYIDDGIYDLDVIQCGAIEENKRNYIRELEKYNRDKNNG